MTNINSNLNEHMKRDAATLLYGNAVAGIAITLLTSSFLVFAFSYPVIDVYKLVWWCGMFTLLLIRSIDTLWWNLKLKHSDFDGEASVKRFAFGANITAIMWSIYLIYSTTHSNEMELTSTIIAVASMAGGSVAVLNAHKFTTLFFPFALLFPGSIALLLSGIYSLQLLGILGFSFTIVILAIAKKSADFTLHTLFLKNENSVLIHQMEEKVKQRTQKIFELSNIDPLTGLYNRSAFLNQLKTLTLSPANSFALLFIDLDGFKKINDVNGHKIGDEILRNTATRINTFTEDSSFVCRWGGDEFLIAFESIDEANAINKSEQLITILSQPHISEAGSLSVGATVGIVLYPEHAESEDRLIQLADMAMYHQKNEMRSKVCVFSEEMEKSYFNDLYLKNALTDAIEHDQLRLVFQPIINAKDLKVVAFEALLRWQLDGENVDTQKFIDIAEQYSLINEIGTWVLNHACYQAAQWDGLGVCVNVSVIQLQQGQFVDIVKKALASSSLAPEFLNIEITESVFASDLAFISKQIKRLQAIGVKVSMDDFGTGYSSLSVMQDLAVDIVKIDRSFVNKLDNNENAIISAIMNISSSLNFLVVAEGVETVQQEKVLLELGVHYLQGYYYAKPLEVGHIKGYLDENYKQTSR